MEIRLLHWYVFLVFFILEDTESNTRFFFRLCKRALPTKGSRADPVMSIHERAVQSLALLNVKESNKVLLAGTLVNLFNSKGPLMKILHSYLHIYRRIGREW